MSGTMLDEQKVRSMARCRLYEQSFGAGTIKINKHFEKGAEKTAFFLHVPAGILTFVLTAFLACVCAWEKIGALYEQLGSGASAAIAGVIFVLFVAAYAGYARTMSRRKYEENKGRFWKYRFIKNKTARLSAEKPEDAAMSGGAGT